MLRAGSLRKNTFNSKLKVKYIKHLLCEFMSFPSVRRNCQNSVRPLKKRSILHDLWPECITVFYKISFLNLKLCVNTCRVYIYAELVVLVLSFRDTAGQERFRTLTEQHYRGAKVRLGIRYSSRHVQFTKRDAPLAIGTGHHIKMCASMYVCIRARVFVRVFLCETAARTAQLQKF